MDAELAFNEELESGITTYLEPLRPILSDITHRTMFMNVEEVGDLNKDEQMLFSTPLPSSSSSMQRLKR